MIPSLDPRSGGVAEALRQSTRMLAGHGHDTTVLTLDAPGSPWLAEVDFTCAAVGPGRGKYGFTRALDRWLDTHGNDFHLVLIEGVWQYHSLAVSRWCVQAKKPYALFLHGMLDPWFKQTYFLKHLKKVLYWRIFEAQVVERAAAVLCTTEQERVLARSSFKPYRANDIVVAIGTASPPPDSAQQRAAFVAAVPAAAGKRALLFLSRIHLKKGIDLLLEAFAGLAATAPDLHLVVAGPDDDGLLPQLQSRATSLGIRAQVSWPGMLMGDAKWGAFRSAELFCLPSHSENFGVVVAEALGCGVPVAITDKVNIYREVIAEGAGWADSDDAAGVARTLNAWAATPADELAAMRTRALTAFNRRFEAGAVAAQFCAALERLVPNAAPAVAPSTVAAH